VRLAYLVAIGTDIAQLALGPAGWIVADEILDVAAMAIISGLIGFHPLFLPTFVLEFVPVADMLPTWTGCVAVVTMLKKRQQVSATTPTRTPPPRGPIIDV
jgi:hypothetical protein